MIGTIVNVCAIVLGSIIGSFLSRGIRPEYKTVVYDGLGLASLAIGLNATLSNLDKSQYPVLFIIAIALGGVIGAAFDLDGRFHRLVNHRSGSTDSHNLADGLALTILLYCIGPLSMLGPVIAALNGDNTFLYTNATLDFVSAVVSHGWLTSAEFTNIVAISQMTPGPIGINSATYCGYTAAYNEYGSTMMGVAGSALATFALVLPSLILMILMAKMLLKYFHTQAVQNIFMGLRPAVVGLLAAATLLLLTPENFSSPSINLWQFCISVFLFVASFVGTMFIGVNPIRMICWAGLAGLVLLY